MSSKSDGSHVLEGWREEKHSGYLYRRLAKHEPVARYSRMYEELATAADAQALLWETQAKEHGVALPDAYRPAALTRLLSALIAILGPRRLRSVLPAHKVRGMSVYNGPAVGHTMPETLADVGKRHHRAGAAGDLRAAVFGANDGLVSNTSLILGMSGAAAGNTTVLLAGLTGLLAGACSMASGEYVSVRAQKEMLERQLALEAEELDLYPEEEAAELALIYEARGLPQSEAVALGQRVIQDPVQALDVLAREELGLDPSQISSPWTAAGLSFLFFALGAIVPVLPFLFAVGNGALWVSIGLAAVALLVLGAGMSLFTGRSVVWSALRMLIIGCLAGGVTFGIGNALALLVGSG